MEACKVYSVYQGWSLDVVDGNKTFTQTLASLNKKVEKLQIKVCRMTDNFVHVPDCKRKHASKKSNSMILEEYL